VRTWNNLKVDAHYIIGILWRSISWAQKIFVTLLDLALESINESKYLLQKLWWACTWKPNMLKRFWETCWTWLACSITAFISSRFNWCRNIWKKIKKCYSSFSWITFTMFIVILIWKIIDFLVTAWLTCTYICFKWICVTATSSINRNICQYISVVSIIALLLACILNYPSMHHANCRLHDCILKLLILQSKFFIKHKRSQFCRNIWIYNRFMKYLYVYCKNIVWHIQKQMTCKSMAQSIVFNLHIKNLL